MSALYPGRALLQACKQGSLADVKACAARVLAIPNPKETSPPMRMAMGAAAYSGHTSSLRHLMASIPKEHWQGTGGPWDPVITLPLDDIPEEWSVTAMPNYVVFQAAAGGVPGVMQALIDHGLAVDHGVERMGSPLGIAILYRKLELVRFLLTKGADPNHSYDFLPVSLLNKAALLGSTAIMQLLLDYGATLQESMALQGAAEGGHIQAAELLLEMGANVNEIFRWNQFDDEEVDVIGSALHVAVRHDQEDMVEFLLRHGARQDLLDGNRATVKALAAEKGNAHIIRLLQHHYSSYPSQPL